MTELYKYRDGQKLTVDEKTLMDFLNFTFAGHIQEGCSVQNVSYQTGKLFQISFGKAKELEKQNAN